MKEKTKREGYLSDSDMTILGAYADCMRMLKYARGENRLELLTCISLLEDDLKSDGLECFITPHEDILAYDGVL